MKRSSVQVQVRFPLATINQIKRAAKLARVTPTQVYNVLLAMAVTSSSPQDRSDK